MKRSSGDDAEGRVKRTKNAESPQVGEKQLDNALVQEDFNPAEQAYCVVPSDKRFGLLCSFLKKNPQKKIVVIFATTRSLKFHGEIFSSLGISTVTISERLVERQRTTVLAEFSDSGKGVLLSTNAAANGFDSLVADWIVQFEPPRSGEAFLRRISGDSSRGLVFLLPEELEFLSFLKKSSVPVTECDFREIKIANMHSQMEKLVQKQFRLHQLAQDAYRAYVVDYSKHSTKDAFNIKKLNLLTAGVSFGIKCPPKVL